MIIEIYPLEKVLMDGVSILLNVADGNIAAAVLSGINTTLLGVPIGLFSRKYFDAKKSQ